MNGKGDTYRAVNRQKWEENYDRIFRKGKGKKGEKDLSTKHRPIRAHKR